jgi:hypothetical protein
MKAYMETLVIKGASITYSALDLDAISTFSLEIVPTQRENVEWFETYFHS